MKVITANQQTWRQPGGDQVPVLEIYRFDPQHDIILSGQYPVRIVGRSSISRSFFHAFCLIVEIQGKLFVTFQLFLRGYREIPRGSD